MYLYVLYLLLPSVRHPNGAPGRQMEEGCANGKKKVIENRKGPAHVPGADT